MSVNNVNGAQPKLYTFAEMGYTAPGGSQQVPTAPQSADTVEIAGQKPKKKLAKGVVAAIGAVAITALAAFGLAKAGKTANGTEKLFTAANFKAGFDKVAGEIMAVPGKILAHFKRGADAAPAPKGDAPAPAPVPAPAPAPDAAAAAAAAVEESLASSGL